MDLGRTVVRGVVGPLFVGHGTQKLFGWFGGHGPEATGGFFESLGLRPGRRHALAAGGAETAAGVLITLGFLTPVATALVSGVMATAIQRVHGKKGPWMSDGGYEYNAVLMAVALALAYEGPGRPSLDAALLPRFRGPGWALAAAGAGVGGALLATAERAPAPSTQRQEDQITFAGDQVSADGSTREPSPAEAS